MAAQPFDHVDRQMRRAGEIAVQALAASEGEMVGLKGLSPEMMAVVEGWLAAQGLVNAQKRAVIREGEEAEEAMVPLKKVYEELLALVQHKGGYTGGAASDHNTDDDFYTAVEDMEEVLRENDGQSWAVGPLAKLTAAADLAAKEYAESVGARRALQKAQANRVEVSNEVRQILIPFRQCVRGTFGSNSKEYRDLLDRRYVKTDGGEPTPTPA